MPENELAVALALELGPALFEHAVVNNGSKLWVAEVGVNGTAIGWIMDEYGIPAWQREEIRRKVLVFAGAVLAEAFKKGD